jgi:hypothetical protein
MQASKFILTEVPRQKSKSPETDEESFGDQYRKSKVQFTAWRPIIYDRPLSTMPEMLHRFSYNGRKGYQGRRSRARSPHPYARVHPSLAMVAEGGGLALILVGDISRWPISLTERYCPQGRSARGRQMASGGAFKHSILKGGNG